MSNFEVKRVSIVLCTYNGEKYLKEQLDTILNQDYPLFEIIIQDDASTDHTWEILEEYKENRSIIKLFRNKKNIGFVYNFLTAAKKAKGDYIAYSDQDDIWYPHKISTMINLIGNSKLLISQDKILNDSNGEYYLSFKNNNPRNLTLSRLAICSNSYSGNQILFDNSLLKYFDIAIKHGLDHVSIVLYSALIHNSIAVTDKVLQTWRRHDNNVTNYFPSKEIRLLNKFKGNKTLYTIFSLAIGNKSSFITRSFSCRYQVIKELTDHKIPNSEQVSLLKLLILLKNQNLCGYVRSSYICYKRRKELFGYADNNFKNTILSFTHVFRHWYNFRFWYW